MSTAEPSRRVITWLSLLLFTSMLLGLACGAVPFNPLETARGLYQWAWGESSQAAIIVGQIRLPRVLLAVMVGAILASSGAAMQGLFRNPLADPSLIGVTAGASLGASITIATGGASSLALISGGAFAGGLLAVLLVYRLAASAGGTSVSTMLLAGIAITALAGAVGNLLVLHADSEVLRRISLWRMGGLEGADPLRLGLAALACLLVAGGLPLFAGALNALLLGESEARYLGIDVERTKTLLVLLVALGVGVAVALAGTIAFVGLVVPHLVRLLIGPDHRRLLPATALAGGILLVVADTLARVLLAPVELPVGIVTALIGVPFFLSLLRQRSRYGML